MSSLDRIVEVIISRSTKTVAAKDFGTILIMGENQDSTELVKEYGSIEELALDFAVTDPEYLAGSVVFAQSPSPAKVLVGYWDPTKALDIYLTLVMAVRDDFYYVTLATDEIPTTDVAPVAVWLAANKRFGVFGTDNSAVIKTPESGDTNSLPQLFNAAGAEKVACLYNGKFRTNLAGEEILGYIDSAFSSMLSIRQPGSYTAYLKQLSSVTPDNLMTGDVTNALTKNCNIYHTIAGLDVTEEGRVTDGQESGEWIDTIIGIDWLEARMQERVFAILVNAEKIPYTDMGIAIIESGVRGVLEEGISNGFLASYEVFAGKAAEQPDADKAQRMYNGLSFQAVLAGAIHRVTIKGSVIY